MDAGSKDAGSTDVGTMDVGVMDAGREDASPVSVRGHALSPLTDAFDVVR